jgi:hypothetical protein
MTLLLLAGWLSLIHPLFLTAEEIKDPFLSQSSFQKMVVFYNQAQQKTEVRIFDDAEFDEKGNAVFLMEKQVPLVLPANRVEAVVPIAPDDGAEISLIDLKKGLEDCSKVSHTDPEIGENFAKWKNLVKRKEDQIAAEKHQEEVRQSKAIQDAAQEKAAEELAVVLKRLEYFDQLNDRKAIQEALESVKCLNPKLLGDPTRLKEAEDYWSFLLSLPPRVAIPKQWPLRIPPEQLLANRGNHEAIGPKVFNHVLLAGSFLIPLFCLSRLMRAVSGKNWFAATTFGVFGSALVVLVSGLLMSYPSQVVLLRPESEPSFLGKAAWQNGDVLEAQITRQNGKNELQILVALGSSYGSIPLFFAFDPDFGKPPQFLKVDRASAGAFPLPAIFKQQVWLFVSQKYSWVQ